MLELTEERPNESNKPLVFLDYSEPVRQCGNQTKAIVLVRSGNNMWDAMIFK